MVGYVAIIILFICAFVLSRLFALKKEVRKIERQLQNYTHRKTNQKISMTLLDQDLESLALEINKLIDLHVTESRKRIRFEHEHKQAIANMSHDLRTPLTSIVGYIQMANDEEVTTDERKEYLSIANKRAKRLEALLNDFFELSMVESTEYTIKTERMNLRNVVVDVLMGFYDRFQAKQMTPTVNIPDTELIIIADRSALIRVVENLLTNALTHSDGNMTITLEEDDAAVQFIVENDVNTLTEQDVNRIFDRFYMADQSRSGKSTGLGLSIAKSLMEKMDGEITGELHEGKLRIVCKWRRWVK